MSYIAQTGPNVSCDFPSRASETTENIARDPSTEINVHVLVPGQTCTQWLLFHQPNSFGPQSGNQGRQSWPLLMRALGEQDAVAASM